MWHVFLCFFSSMNLLFLPPYHTTTCTNPIGLCLLSNNVRDYHFVSQGKTTIPDVDDGEEMKVTDVSITLLINHHTQMDPKKILKKRLWSYHHQTVSMTSQDGGGPHYSSSLPFFPVISLLVQKLPKDRNASKMIVPTSRAAKLESFLT